MVILIAGGTHTGKTLLAQRLMEQCRMPYLSIDHLKMGLIRSGLCPLSPESGDKELTAALWPVVREMVKTAIENHQSLIVEGCYIPFDFQRDFAADYLAHIRFVCLIFSEAYIEGHYADIVGHANAIETRLAGDAPPKEAMLAENAHNLAQCRQYGLKYILIEGAYQVDFTPC